MREEAGLKTQPLLPRIKASVVLLRDFLSTYTRVLPHSAASCITRILACGRQVALPIERVRVAPCILLQ